MNEDSLTNEQTLDTELPETPTKAPLPFGYRLCVGTVFVATLLAKTGVRNSKYEGQSLEFRSGWWLLFAFGSFLLVASPIFLPRFREFTDPSHPKDLCRAGVLGYGIYWYGFGYAEIYGTQGFFVTLGLIAAYWAFRWCPGPNRPLIHVP
jgi:hypothetical protein